MKFLITGGAGYIGSTICAALEDAGHTPVILDSLITGREEFTRHPHFLPRPTLLTKSPWRQFSKSILTFMPPSTVLR